MGEIANTVERKLYVSGSHYIETALMQKSNKTYIHLLNTAGEHRAARVKTFDEIPPIHNVTVVYKTGKRPQSVRLLPENIVLPFDFVDKTLKIFIDSVKIHSAIEIV